jgi:hypothetical protein
VWQACQFVGVLCLISAFGKIGFVFQPTLSFFHVVFVQIISVLEYSIELSVMIHPWMLYIQKKVPQFGVKFVCLSCLSKS